MRRKLSASTLMIRVGLGSAVLALIFLALASPLAIPAEAQEATAEEATEATTEEATSRTGGSDTGSAVEAGDAATGANDATTSDDAVRTPASDDTANTAQQVREAPRVMARASTPLAASTDEMDVRITDTGDDDIIVNSVAIAAADCTAEEGATVIVEDADGTRVRLIDGQNVDIMAAQDRVLAEGSDPNGNINGFPTDTIGGDDQFGRTDSTVAGEVIASTGITCENDDGGAMGNPGGGNASNNGNGDDGVADNGASNDLNCRQVLQIFRNGQNDQYFSLDGVLAQQTQVCLENEVIVNADTDKPLPETGGPPLLAFAALGLASAAVGVSVLRAGLRRVE